MKKRDADRCKACGSADLFDTCINRQGYAVTDGSGRWTTVCNQCGQDQDKPARGKSQAVGRKVVKPARYRHVSGIMRGRPAASLPPDPDEDR